MRDRESFKLTPLHRMTLRFLVEDSGAQLIVAHLGDRPHTRITRTIVSGNGERLARVRKQTFDVMRRHGLWREAPIQDRYRPLGATAYVPSQRAQRLYTEAVRERRESHVRSRQESTGDHG